MKQHKSIPLFHKLNLEDGIKIKLINEPENYSKLLNLHLKQIEIVKKLNEPVNVIHLFTNSKDELKVELPILKRYLTERGIIWVSWPGNSIEYYYDINEIVVRRLATVNNFNVVESVELDDKWLAAKLITN